MKSMKTTSLLCALSLPLTLSLHAENLRTFDDFAAAAAKTNAVLALPDWEHTPEAVDAIMKNAIDTVNKALDEIGKQDLSKVTFQSTVVALDDLTWTAGNAANRVVVIKESSPDAKVREAA